jgi:hypothetical protein
MICFVFIPLLIGLFPGADAMAQTPIITVGTASGLPGSTVSVSVGFTPGGTPVSLPQFDLMFPSSLSYSSVTTGPAAQAAGKTAAGNAISGGARFLVSGGVSAIGSGVIAIIQLNVSAGASPGTIPVTITGIVCAAPDATQVPANGVSGSVTVLAPSDITAPTISSVTATAITGTSATISWTTNELSDTQVDYGTTASYGSSTTLNGSMVTSHSQGLTVLTAGTLYHYRVKSRDAAGNLATSGDYTFTTTAAADTTPPTISGVTSSSISSTGATISWTTNEAGDTQVDYGTTASYGSSTTLNSGMTTSHSQGLTGLTASTLYHYRVKSRDAAGNLATSSDYTFTTTAAADTTPPTISGVTSSSISGTGATISWTTNEAADTQVDYGTTVSYGSTTTLNSTLSTAHAQGLTGLSASRLYHYRVKSRDAAGNLAMSVDYTFTTQASSDITPPVISAVSSSNISGSSATITWTTDEAADTQVEYGTTSSYGSAMPLIASLTTAHSQSLTGLTANTLYHYRVISKDAAGNLAVSSDNTFTTSARSGTAPVISAIVVSITSTSATITWKTDRPSDSAVEYWIGNQTSRRAAVLATLVADHSLTLNRLQKSTTYKLQVKSTDSDANQAVTPELSFTTTARSAPTLSVPLLPSEYSSLQILRAGENSMIGFALANTGTATATVTFTAVDDSGALITGQDITNPSVRELKPYNQKALLDSDIFGEGIQTLNPKGWVKLESTSSDVSGFYLIFDSSLSYMDGASFGDTALKNLLFPEIQPVGATRISIANPGSEAATVAFNLMKANGTIRSSRLMEIRASGAFVGDLYSDVFLGTEPDPTDYVLMDSTAGVHAFELMQSFGDISSLTGQNSAMGAATLYSPQYVSGDPWRTRLSVINLDSQPGTVTMQLMDDHGVAMGTTRTVPIAANGKLYIDDPGFFTPLQAGAITTGYLKIQSDGVRLAGSTVFGDSMGQSFSAALPLVDDLRNSVLYSHIASNDLYFTGIAMVNPNAVDATVDIAVVGADGITICRKMDLLPAMQKTSRLLTELFPALVGQDLASGYILIRSSQPIASFSLFGTNSLSVLSAIPPQ